MSEEQMRVSGKLQENPCETGPAASAGEEEPVQEESLDAQGQPPAEPAGKKPALPAKTQGVRAPRADGGRRALERAAKAAARTGRRGDVHEYMRIRRGYV